jgi:hypothetical protein
MPPDMRSRIAWAAEAAEVDAGAVLSPFTLVADEMAAVLEPRDDKPPLGSGVAGTGVETPLRRVWDDGVATLRKQLMGDGIAPPKGTAPPKAEAPPPKARPPHDWGVLTAEGVVAPPPPGSERRSTNAGRSSTREEADIAASMACFVSLTRAKSCSHEAIEASSSARWPGGALRS